MSKNDLTSLAEYASRYLMPKVNDLTGNCVRFYRAEVTKAAADGVITVKRPFDDAEQALPYIQSMEDAEVGSQVIVFVFGSAGNANNSVIVNDGRYSIGGSGGGSGGGDSDNLWYPSVSSDGVISWRKSNSTTTPASVSVKGEKGVSGTDGVTPDISATASVSASTGTPSVTVTKYGENASPTFDFAFSGLKGEKGDTGPQGPQGEKGESGGITGLDDYVTEHETSGSWNYRKWNSGYVEMWGLFTPDTTSGNAAYINVTYPVALTGQPTDVQATSAMAADLANIGSIGACCRSVSATGCTIVTDYASTSSWNTVSVKICGYAAVTPSTSNVVGEAEVGYATLDDGTVVTAEKLNSIETSNADTASKITAVKEAMS